MAFVVLKELVRSMPPNQPEPVSQEYEGGVRLLVSAKAREGMRGEPQQPS